jgi:hypothetical protein
MTMAMAMGATADSPRRREHLLVPDLIVQYVQHNLVTGTTSSVLAAVCTEGMSASMYVGRKSNQTILTSVTPDRSENISVRFPSDTFHWHE